MPQMWCNHKMLGKNMILLELAQQIGLSPKRTASTQGGEYHASCPACGGNDRFILQPNKSQKNCVGYYFCRQCNKKGDTIQFCIDFLHQTFQEALRQVGATLPEQKRSFRHPFVSPQHTTTIAIHITPPPALWMERAAILVDWAHQQLLLRFDVLQYLEKRGIPLEAVKAYKIGFIPINLYRNRTDWGLTEEMDIKGNARKLWIPKGIVIPTTEPNGNVIRIKIRSADWRVDDKLPKYAAISGSMNGLNIIGSKHLPTAIIVESELDAYALHHAMNDSAFVIAIGSNMKHPDLESDYLVKRKQLIVLYDNDDAGKKMLAKWQYAHVQCHVVPYGKDVGEYIEGGGNIKSFMHKIIEQKP